MRTGRSWSAALVLLCGLALVCGCESSTGTEFPYEGAWVGTWQSPPNSGAFGIKVKSNGSFFGGGSLDYSEPPSTVNLTVSVTALAYSDGSVVGSAVLENSTDDSNVSGTVAGQLGASSGSGTMQFDIDGSLVEMTWSITRM
jgi:hypothetical protein